MRPRFLEEQWSEEKTEEEMAGDIAIAFDAALQQERYAFSDPNIRTCVRFQIVEYKAHLSKVKSRAGPDLILEVRVQAVARAALLWTE